MVPVFTAGSWHLSLVLTHAKAHPELKLPTEQEIKAMLKQAYQRFRESINKAKNKSERGIKWEN